MKRFERSMRLEKVELPFIREYLYILRIGDDIAFVHPELVVDTIFLNNPFMVFPVEGRIVHAGDAIAIVPVYSNYSNHVLYLLTKEDLKELDDIYRQRAYRFGNKFFLHSLPFPDVEEEWDEDDDYYDDEYDEYEDDESEVSEDSSVE